MAVGYARNTRAYGAIENFKLLISKRFNTTTGLDSTVLVRSQPKVYEDIGYYMGIQAFFLGAEQAFYV